MGIYPAAKGYIYPILGLLWGVEKGDQARGAALAWEGEEGQEDLFQDGAQIEQSDKEGGKDVDCANVESVKQALARDGFCMGVGVEVVVLFILKVAAADMVHMAEVVLGNKKNMQWQTHWLKTGSGTATGRGIQTRSQRARQGSFASDGGFTGPLAKLNLQVPQLARFAFTID